MTEERAKQIGVEFAKKSKVSPEEVELFKKAMIFLITDKKDPWAMMLLGTYYYEKKDFDPALELYERAAHLDYDDAYDYLGFIWYYGRTGTKDYEKAYKYFHHLMEKGNYEGTYKVADMYKHGYYVEKDEEKYERMIEELYPKVRECINVYDPVPEVYTRYAEILAKRGKEHEAVNLYFRAKKFLAQRIKHNSFFGNLNIMRHLIDDLYELVEFDEGYFDFYDTYYLLKEPHSISFLKDNAVMRLKSTEDGCVCFNGKWYENRDEFFQYAEVSGVKLTTIYEELYGFDLLN
ncbi:MAG: sel1 repeat family protein [Lachnospiraceae bacterium]|nr:sel1 repeat family protein [Lachnospiraceae bacterium]